MSPHIERGKSLARWQASSALSIRASNKRGTIKTWLYFVACRL
jgi:hypothetical protein